ncbi:MAG TPA: hypothetical protein VIV64_04565 [Gammaproteobacteria bacterium]|jgi:hypothetical protein
MKVCVSIVIAGFYFATVTGFAQESVPANAAASGNQEAEERELTRAERRALRRSEREARDTSARVATAEESDGNDEGIVCRRESVTGTHRRVRICTTRAERELAREAAQETIREAGRMQGPLGAEGN